MSRPWRRTRLACARTGARVADMQCCAAAAAPCKVCASDRAAPRCRARPAGARPLPAPPRLLAGPAEQRPAASAGPSHTGTARRSSWRTCGGVAVLSLCVVWLCVHIVRDWGTVGRCRTVRRTDWINTNLLKQGSGGHAGRVCQLMVVRGFLVACCCGLMWDSGHRIGQRQERLSRLGQPVLH